MFDPPETIEGHPEPPALKPAYTYSFTASAELHEAIERLKDVLWNKIPFGTLDEFLKVAVLEYLDRHDLSLQPPENTPEPVRDKGGLRSSRYVPRAVRRAVWARDGARCAFVAEDGRRCECRRGLEMDHIVPFSVGGSSGEAGNLRLLCREHNQLERRLALGEGAPARLEGFPCRPEEGDPGAMAAGP